MSAVCIWQGARIFLPDRQSKRARELEIKRDARAEKEQVGGDCSCHMFSATKFSLNRSVYGRALSSIRSGYATMFPNGVVHVSVGIPRPLEYRCGFP